MTAKHEVGAAVYRAEVWDDRVEIIEATITKLTPCGFRVREYWMSDDSKTRWLTYKTIKWALTKEQAVKDMRRRITYRLKIASLTYTRICSDYRVAFGEDPPKELTF